MGPTRTAKTPLHAESSSSGAGRTPNSKTKRYHGAPAPEPESTPGVQKIKASLRQTRRLLAKDKLAADVRVETERRLKALEADLAQAELTKKEKALAVRYHKIKFFERQKVVRKLNQTMKRLETNPTSSSVKEELEELRVDLNYILHYPKTKKYISLFPPEVRKAKDEGGDDVVTDKAERKEKKLEDKAEKKEVQKTDTEREEVKVWIREQMKKGVFSAEPEMHLDSRTIATVKRSGKGDEWGGDVEKAVKGGKKGKVEKEQVAVEEGDAFFGDDDEDDDRMDEDT